MSKQSSAKGGVEAGFSPNDRHRAFANYALRFDSRSGDSMPASYAASPATYEIRLASTPLQQKAVDRLVQRMYAWRGYSVQPGANFSQSESNRAVLSAWQQGKVVATLTLRRDSADGLMADELYDREMASIRSPGRVVCEVTRLAVHPGCSASGMLNSLFAAALRHAREQLVASDAVIEVNPRHVRYYQSRLGFQPVGTMQLCPRVNAPAVLMHQSLDAMSLTEAFRAGPIWVKSA